MIEISFYFGMGAPGRATPIPLRKKNILKTPE
jgi:hypothetical protein